MVEDAREEAYDGVIKVMAFWGKKHNRRCFNTVEDYLQIGRETRVRYAKTLAELELKHAVNYLKLSIKSAILADKRCRYVGGSIINRRALLFPYPKKKYKSGGAIRFEDVLSVAKWDDALAQVERDEERRKLLVYVDGIRTNAGSYTKAMMRDYVFGTTIIEASRKYRVKYPTASDVYQRLIRGARAYFGGAN